MRVIDKRNYLLLVFLTLLLFVLLSQSVVFADYDEDIEYSPLYDVSLKNTLREFEEKQVAFKPPGVPSIPSVPSVPSYTSSYSCGATCGATCGSTCGATCGATCGSTCNATCVGNSTCVGSSTCAGSSTCMGSSTCAGSHTCIGSNTCAGNSTCVGTSTCYGSTTCAGSTTCFGSSTCVGGATCIGTNTCAGTSTCAGSATCIGSHTCIGTGGCTTPKPNPEPSPKPNDPIPETPSAPGQKPTSNTPSSWAIEGVESAIALELVPEKLQGNYQSNITREEYCELTIQFLRVLLEERQDLLELLNSDPGKVFDDTDNEEVSRAAQLDLVSGVGNNKFEPKRSINREEAAKLLLNLSNEMLMLESSQDPVSFSDSAEISEWAKEAVVLVVNAGVMNGVGNNRFDPKGSYTREQSILTMHRLYLKFFGIE